MLNDREFALELEGNNLKLTGFKNTYNITLLNAEVRSYPLGNTWYYWVFMVILFFIFFMASLEIFEKGLLITDRLVFIIFYLLFQYGLTEIFRRKTINYWVLISGKKQDGEIVNFLIHDGRFGGWPGAITKNRAMLKRINEELQRAPSPEKAA